jgi:cellulose synthase/poly-beta-1,6-N-acetylglucosamine synthase-like glycosyltransferase
MRRLMTVTEHTLFMAISLALIGIGVYQGMHLYTVRLDVFWIAVEIFLLDAVRAAVMFTVFIGVSAALFGWRMRGQEAEPDVDGPACAAIILAYQEVTALPTAVDAVLSQTYENLSVVITCQTGDPETRQVAEELAAAHDRVRLLVNEDGPQSKPGNVNHAVEQTEEPVIAVFDADSRPAESFIATAVAALADADVVQGRVISDPSGVLETIAYYEDILISTLSRQFVYLFTGFRLALSNGTVMSRDAYETVGGYHDVLADDFAFAFDCYRNRLDVTLLRRPAVIREPVHTVRDWWGQRKRWLTSYVQVFHRLLTDIRSFHGRRDIISLFIAGSSVIGGAFMLILATKVVMLMVLGAQTLFLLPAVLLILAGIAIHAADYRAGAVGRPSPVILVIPFIIPLFAVIAVKSLLSYVFSWSGDWYHTMRQNP